MWFGNLGDGLWHCFTMFYPHYLKFTLNLKLLDLCCFGQRLGESQIGLVRKWGILSLRVFSAQQPHGSAFHHVWVVKTHHFSTCFSIFWVNKTPKKQFFPSEGAPFSAEHASWRLEARGTGEPWSDWSSWILWTFFWAVVNLGELVFLVATQHFGGLYDYHRFFSNRGVLRRGWRLIGRLILETTENRQTDEKIGIEPANRWNILGTVNQLK